MCDSESCGFAMAALCHLAADLCKWCLYPCRPQLPLSAPWVVRDRQNWFEERFERDVAAVLELERSRLQLYNNTVHVIRLNREAATTLSTPSARFESSYSVAF
jgi:hypothetical protein